MITLRHVVGAAILQSGQVMAAQRGPGMSQSGVWEFPGGKLEAGESESEALQRELVEEMDLKISPFLRLGSVIRVSRRLRLTVWLCRAEGLPTLREHSAWRWLSAGALDSVGWSEPDRPFLPLVRHYLEGK